MTWVFPCSVTFYIYSTTSQREILDFLLHYIYLTTLVTLQIQIINTKYNHITIKLHITIQLHWMHSIFKTQILTIYIIIIIVSSSSNVFLCVTQLGRRPSALYWPVATDG